MSRRSSESIRSIDLQLPWYSVTRLSASSVRGRLAAVSRSELLGHLHVEQSAADAVLGDRKCPLVGKARRRHWQPRRRCRPRVRQRDDRRRDRQPVCVRCRDRPKALAARLADRTARRNPQDEQPRQHHPGRRRRAGLLLFQHAGPAGRRCRHGARRVAAQAPDAVLRVQVGAGHVARALSRPGAHLPGRRPVSGDLRVRQGDGQAALEGRPARHGGQLLASGRLHAPTAATTSSSRERAC